MIINLRFIVINMEWLVANKEWVFSGVGVIFIVMFKDVIWSFIKSIYDNFLKGSSLPPQSKMQLSNTKEAIVQNLENSPITTNNNFYALTPSTDANKSDFVGFNMQDIKARTHILFIDDQAFPVYKTLKSSGWTHTTLIKDIKSLDDPEIINNDIFFIDIRGVGKKLFNDEGLGIAKALKNKYPYKKVIIYSAETMGNRFDEAFRIADDFLQKNADFYDFLEIVEKFAKEMYSHKKTDNK